MQGFTVRCGQKVLQNWIKIALVFLDCQWRSLKKLTAIKYAVQFASSRVAVEKRIWKTKDILKLRELHLHWLLNCGKTPA